MLKNPKSYQAFAAGVLCVISNSAVSGGFALIENSASGAGNAYAGAAAIYENPSAQWFNPALMASSPNQSLSVGAHIVNATSDFTNKGTSTSPALGGNDISGGEGDPSGMGIVPNLFYVKPMNSDFTFGLGINSPFGSNTKYDRDWVGRYHGVESAVLSLNINPSIAWHVNDQLSLGAGFNAQYFHVNLTTAVDSGSVCLGIAPSTALRAECIKAGLTPANQERDGYGEVSGDDWSFNYNLGMVYKVTPKTTLGLSYRASIDHQLEGEADFDVDPVLAQFINAAGSSVFSDTDVLANASLPASIVFGLDHQVNNKLNVLGGITWTEWSTFEELRIKYDNPSQPDTVTREDWKDVMRYSLGINYKESDKWIYRAGIAYDEEAIPSAVLRTPRIPGNDRTWITVGAGYKINDTMDIDFAYAHLFLDETPIDHTDESLGHTTRGMYDAAVDIISAQLNWHFE